MQEYFVDTPDTLRDLIGQLVGSEWLALDTEFIREKTYYPNLCLLQVSNGEIAACIDPLKLKDLSPLLEVLYDGCILKVLHAARQDLEIFLHTWGRIPLPLFDTQPAAALLGFGDQISYAKLVRRLLGVTLDKDHSRTDWSRRPLDPGQQRYALNDVIYLGQAYLAIRGQLSDQSRLQWLASDFADLADPTTYVPHPKVVWRRVKGRQTLRGVQLAILQALAAWREEEARMKDLPRKWLIKDEVLIEIARRKPQTLVQLSQLRGVDAGLVRRCGDNLLQLVAQAVNTPPDSWPTEKPSQQSLSAVQEAQTDLLSAALRVIAHAERLSPQAIATRKDLEQLVRGETEIALLEGWRRKLAGEPLLGVLHGSIRVTSQSDRVTLT